MHFLVIPLQLPRIGFRILYPSAPNPYNAHNVMYTERCVDTATWPPSPFLSLSSTPLHFPLYLHHCATQKGKRGGTYSTPSSFPRASPLPRCFRTSSSRPRHHVRSWACCSWIRCRRRCIFSSSWESARVCRRAGGQVVMDVAGGRGG